MKLFTNDRVLAAALLLICAALSACEYEAPPSPWEEAQKKPQVVPVITKVMPENAGSASEITIVGDKFSPNPSENIVYFNNARAIIKSASASQIVVYRPAITGEALVIKVVVTGAIGIAQYSPYKLEPIIAPFGIFLDADAIAAATMDRDENTYVVLRNTRVTIKLTPEGKRDDAFVTPTNSVFGFTTDMKVGPEGYLYILREREDVYRVAPQGGAVASFVRFPSGKRAKYLDFDQNGNMYAAGEKTGLLLLKPDKTTATLGHYEAFNIQTVRVYSGYVYVAAVNAGTDPQAGPTGIYRNAIQPDGQVGPKELVLDWSTTGEYATTLINGFDFSAAGDMYIGTNHTSPILRVRSDGSKAPLYVGLISPSVDQIFWGNQKFLYLVINRRTPKSDGGLYLRVNIDELGAPYYGRNL